MNISFYKTDIKRIFKENGVYYDWDICPTDGTITINVEWGDWKHDHLFLQYIMRQNNYRVVSRVVTEEDDTDCYSAEYEFKYGI